MPGTASHLDRHEWIKHGSCFFGGRQGQAYFSASLQALDTVNGAGVADFLAARVGGSVTSAELRAVFDQAFGAGAGERVQMQCKGDGGRVLVQDITVTLNGELTGGADIGALILAGDPQSAGCAEGVIDPAGLK